MAIGGTIFLTNLVSMAVPIVAGIGVVIAILGIMKLVEGYGDDSPATKSQGMKQLMYGAAVSIIGANFLQSAMTAVVARSETGFVGALMPGIRAIIIGIGAAIGLFGVINLLEGYGGDNPAAKSQGKKQLIAGLALGVIGSDIALMFQAAVLGGGSPGQLFIYVGNIVSAIGAGMAIWGVVNLIEGYGGDSPAAKSQGVKQLVAGSAMIPLGNALPGPLSTIAFGGAPGALVSAVANTLASATTGIGVGLGIWGIAHLIEGYGGDNPGAKSQGIKQFMAAVGLIAIGAIMTDVIQTLANLGGAADLVTQVINILGSVVIAIGVGIGLWGLVNLFEAYGGDNPAGKSQGIKQFMAAVGMFTLGSLLPGALTPFVMGAQGAGDFITGMAGVVGSIVAAIGGGIAAWGFINLLEAYGSDSTSSKAQGIKQFVTGCGVLIFAAIVPPALTAVLSAI